MALVTDTVNETQEFLSSFEEAASSVGSHLNESKTKYVTVNCPTYGSIKSVGGETTEKKADYKYLGSWIGSSEHDFMVHKAKAWGA